VDVQEFARDLSSNIIQLHMDLADASYRHGGYYAFRIADPKPREIHKASVRDRLVHHAIYRLLYPFFDRTFIADSFSCRDGKGVHRALARFDSMARTVSQNHRRTCWILKCDIRKFFASIDHVVLIGILHEYISDERIMNLLVHVIESFETSPGVGLPLGNLTSQLFTNVYMNVFDQFMKHTMRAKFYIRYADDFVIFSEDKLWLEKLLPKMQEFLITWLGLTVHPDKIYLRTIASGVDYLGWVNFLRHRVLRRATRRRMFRRIVENPTAESLSSYRGLLQHGNAIGLQKELNNLWWILSPDFPPLTEF
jgi:retron-type reverse transcriptase